MYVHLKAAVFLQTLNMGQQCLSWSSTNLSISGSVPEKQRVEVPLSNTIIPTQRHTYRQLSLNDLE